MACKAKKGAKVIKKIKKAMPKKVKKSGPSNTTSYRANGGHRKLRS